MGLITLSLTIMAIRALRKCLKDTTPYLVFLMAIVTLGPLLFGFHIVRSPGLSTFSFAGGANEL
jgi:hypothetical protein